MTPDSTDAVRPSSKAAPVVAGVDGCRGGWVVVTRTPGRLGAEARFVESFAEILSTRQAPAIIAVDMPIGLLSERETGGRACDREARRRLPGRASSVFSPPIRRVLSALTFEETHGSGLTIQAFHLLPKIRELDAIVTPGRQRRIRECHPELVFTRLAGTPPRHSKKTEAGQRERLALLRRDGRLPLDARTFRKLRADLPASHVRPDDLLDAAALAVAAEDMHAGTAFRVPDRPDRDARGLRMEIWY